MAGSSNLLKAALASDLTDIYRRGFPPKVEAGSIPALAELAEALSNDCNDGQDDYHRQVVEALLRRAIGHLRVENRSGVIELLGIDYEEGQGIGVRRDSAAEHLGFKSGESLRKTRRQGRYVIELLLDDVVDCLIALADAAKFVYTARFTLSPTQPVPSDSEMAAVGPLAQILLGELRELFTQGFAEGQARSVTPSLNRLAEIVVRGTGSSTEKAEVFLRSGIHQAESDPSRRTGVEDLLGIGHNRDSELERRRDRAAKDLGEKRAGMLPRKDRETPILIAIRDALLALAIDAGFLN